MYVIRHLINRLLLNSISLFHYKKNNNNSASYNKAEHIFPDMHKYIICWNEEKHFTLLFGIKMSSLNRPKALNVP